MAKYIAKRLVYMVFVFFIMSILMFGIYKMVPGDPARLLLEGSKAGMKPEVYEMQYQQARERLGLDKPIPVQYAVWITNMLKGDFGYSSNYRKDVIDVVAQPLSNTMQLNLVAIVVVFAITIPLGIICAVKKRSTFDNVVQVFSVVGYSLPTFIIALVLICLLAVKAPIFPVSGVNSVGFTGSALAKAFDKLWHMALPVLVMVLGSIGSITRYVRAAMIESLSMDYIRTARAKGVRERAVIYSHAFRNALLPIVTIVTGWIMSVFSGSVIIENIFLWPGIGKILFDGLMQQDFMVVLAMQMFYVIIALLGNLIMDIAYCMVDPRVKLD
nr:ABC transporter permease [Anaerosporobacter faecicola]